MHRPITRLLAILTTAATLPALATAADTCSVRSAGAAPLVVELYTSEGCNSCPPADRWLSTLKGRADVVSLAFHVDYWDRLGWKDRFASPAWTQRQQEVVPRSGARFSYTPQVLVNGRDYRQWPSLPAASRTAGAAVELQIERDGAGYVARVAGAGARELSGYWAVTEDGHRTQVKSGENAGVALEHDAVVRELQPVARIGEAPLRFTPRTAPDAVSGPLPRKLHFVVTDARSGEPLQAAKLPC